MDTELGGNGSGGRPGKSCGRGAKSNQNSSHKIPKEPIGDIRKEKKEDYLKIWSNYLAGNIFPHKGFLGLSLADNKVDWE